MMVEGDEWEVYIPSELGYGKKGRPGVDTAGATPEILPGEVLIFRLQLLKIFGKKVPANRCDPETLKGCSKEAKAYVRKMRQRGAAKIQEEQLRLKGRT